jgi:competence protein ComGC
MADNKDKKSFNKGTGQPSLNDVLKTSSEANKISGSYQNRGAENGAAVTPKSLDEILNKDQIKQLVKQGVAGSASPSDLPRLDDLVNTGTNSKSSQKRDSSHRDQPAKTVHQIINSTKVEGASKQEKRVEGVAGQKHRKIISIVIITVFVVIATSFFNAKQDKEKVPESALAQQLMVVVNGIERYRLENNKTPEKLSDLPEFPKGAVEWKIDQYNLRLEASALEFFFWEDFNGYIVVSRLEDEAWMYTDQGNSKIRRVPAR